MDFDNLDKSGSLNGSNTKTSPSKNLMDDLIDLDFSSVIITSFQSYNIYLVYHVTNNW